MMFLVGLLRGCMWPALIGMCVAAFLWFVVGVHPPGGCREGYSKQLIDDSWKQRGYRMTHRVEIFKCVKGE